MIIQINIVNMIDILDSEDLMVLLIQACFKPYLFPNLIGGFL